MRLKQYLSSRQRRGESAFTMIEIALSLAVIGFALVAIIGVLPFGMSVQRENREETIINQEANYWMEAIRTGVRGQNDLPLFVESITNAVTSFNANGGAGATATYGYTMTSGRDGVTLATPGSIVGLLSIPKYEQPKKNAYQSNSVTAYVRAMSGSLADKPPQTNAAVLDMAFGYKLTVEVVPQLPPPGIGDRQRLAPPDPSTNAVAGRTLRNEQNNLYEVRLTFRWPLAANGSTGGGRQTFRAVMSGQLVPEPTGANGLVALYHLKPRVFTRAQQP